MLIGSEETPEGHTARQALVDIYASWVPRERIIESNVWSAELSKLTANAFLAQRISSINSISALCEKTEADVRRSGLCHRHGLAYRRQVPQGQRRLRRLVLPEGHSESGLPRRHLRPLGSRALLGVGGRLNEWQQSRFVRTMLTHMFNTVAGKRIAIFGFAFKADTGDTRESPALAVTQGPARRARTRRRHRSQGPAERPAGSRGADGTVSSKRTPTRPRPAPMPSP